MALTVGVATVLDSREVVVVVTGLRKSIALSKAIGTCCCRQIGGCMRLEHKALTFFPFVGMGSFEQRRV